MVANLLLCECLVSMLYGQPPLRPGLSLSKAKESAFCTHRPNAHTQSEAQSFIAVSCHKVLPSLLCHFLLHFGTTPITPLCHIYCATPSPPPPPFFLAFSHSLRGQTPSPAPPSLAPTTTATPHVCLLNATPPHSPFSLSLSSHPIPKTNFNNDHTAPPSRRSRSWIRQQRCASRSTDSAQAVSGSIKAQATVRANSTW